MISRNARVLAILSAAIVTAGCSRSRSAGERMIEPTAQPVVVESDQPVTDPLPPLPPTTTASVTRPATTTATTTAVVTTSVSTRPIGTNPTTRLEPMWVARDADTATRMRNWTPVVSYYSSGNTIAGPVYRIMPPEPRTRNADDILWMEAYTDVLALGGIIAAPVWMLFTPPNTAVEYHGVEYPPSYTLTDARPDDYVVKIPGIIQLRRPAMSQEYYEHEDRREPAGSTVKQIRGSSMDSLPGDRR